MFQPFIPVLAVGAGTIITFVVFTVYVLSWIANLFQGNKPNAAKARNRPRAGNAGQSELERFLQQVVKQQEPERPRPAPKPNRPAAEKKKPKQPQQPQPQPQASRPVTRLVQGRLEPSLLGEGVRAHVSSHMESRTIDSMVQSDISSSVRRDIDDSVQKDMGAGLGADSTVTQRKTSVHPLMQAIRNPQGVRQAIILSEILNRPRSLK